MDRDPLLIEHHIPSNLLGVNLQSAGRIRIIFYCIIPTCLELLAYIIHMTADLTLSIQHYYIDKNPLYGGLTLLFVLLPAFIWFLLILLSPAQWSFAETKYQRRTANYRNKVNATTTTTTTSGINNTNNSMNNNYINNFNIDRSNNDSNDYSNVGCFRNFLQKFIKKENWIFFGKLLFNLIFFPFVAIQRFSHKIFWSIEALFHENGTNERYDSIANACKSSKFQLYFFVQSYAQSAPQIILQLYIILRQDMFRNYETTNLQILSIVFSMINMAFITTSFQRFESQKIVGRYYPWATIDQLQNHKEKFSRAISATELSRQLSENNRNRRHTKSDYFPENDKILQKLSETIPSTKLQQLNENSYNDQFLNDTNIDNDIDNYNDDDDKLKEDYNNGNRIQKNKKNPIRNRDEKNFGLLNQNNENFLVSSECIDLISSSSSTEEDTMNVTDDEKLKNSQQTNNKKNNQRTTSQTDENENENSNDLNYPLKENRKIIENENENVFNGSIDLTNIKSSDTFLSAGKDFTIEKNQEDEEQLQQQQQFKKLKKNLLKQNNNNKNVLRLSDEDIIEHIGEEDIDPNELPQYQKYNNNNQQQPQQQRKPRRSIKFSDEIDYDSPDTELFDKPPESPPPPPPPPSTARTSSTKSFNSNRNSYTNPFDKLFSQNNDYNNKRNSNPFKKLSIYKDMLIYNTEIYIMENVPHPPQFICDRIDSTPTPTTTATTQNQKSTSISPTINTLEEIDKELKKITKSNQNKYKLEKYPSPKRYSMSTSDEPLPILQSSLSLSLSLQNKNSEIIQNKKLSSSSSSFTRQPSNTYVSDNNIDLLSNKNLQDENLDDKTEDTVDFFLPKRGKSFHGIEQDDFFGKCTGFFGWFMFIYMRMISLSVFSVFYQFEFFYLILGHYLLMLIFLSIDIKNFKENIKKLPFYIFLSYVYIFIILEFKIHFNNVKLWYISYLILVIVENFTMTFLWKSQLNATNDDSWDGFIEEYELNSYWWFDFLYLTTWGSFIIFLSCLIVYYLILKPKNVVLIEKE